MLVRLRQGATEQGNGALILKGIAELAIDRCTANFDSDVSKRCSPVICGDCPGCCCIGGADLSSGGNGGNC